MGSRRRPELNLRSFVDPDVARSAKKVFRSVKEGHGRVPDHPEFVNSAFGNASGT